MGTKSAAMLKRISQKLFTSFHDAILSADSTPLLFVNLYKRQMIQLKARFILPLTQAKPDTLSKSEKFSNHFQTTMIGQHQLDFHAPYTGVNSLLRYVPLHLSVIYPDYHL